MEDVAQVQEPCPALGTSTMNAHAAWEEDGHGEMRVPGLALPLVSWGLFFSGPQFPHLCNGHKP